MPTSAGKRRRALRALAHSLKPAVLIGQRGVTPSVLRQIDTALVDHELIKVKLSAECPEERHDAGAAIVAELACELAGVVGRVLVLYRPHPEHPRIEAKLPKAGDG